MNRAVPRPHHTFPWRGLGQHLLVTLRLNFRSRAPLVYGYLVPVFFLLAFGSVFRTGSPPLLREMGQLLTITILGGACFGLPTAMVAERSRGVWRRYRLLPAPARTLVLSANVARVLLVGSAAALQLALAWSLYRTPWPAYAGQFVLAFGGVCFAFLGVGLVIVMVAENVPAVQAIGQCVFLPMIMIGGVGVPLRALPGWAQRVAGFLPGRYAVEALDACILPGGGGLAAVPFALGALGIIGAAGFTAGFGLFRWDTGPRALDRAARGWIALALAAWVLVGALAWTGSCRVPATVQTAAPKGKANPPALNEPWQRLSANDVAGIRYDDLPPDDGIVAPVATSPAVATTTGQARIRSIADTLARWPPAREGTLEQRARNLLVVCASADLAEDENEGDIALIVFDRLRTLAPAPELARVLAWIVLHPTEGTADADLSPFGIEPVTDGRAVRERSAVYARKLLLRLRQNR